VCYYFVVKSGDRSIKLNSICLNLTQINVQTNKSSSLTDKLNPKICLFNFLQLDLLIHK